MVVLAKESERQIDRHRERERETSLAVAIAADVRHGLGVRVGRARSVCCLYHTWQGHPDY
jgi:hypothetical protein